MQHYRADNYQARTSIGYLVRRATALMIEKCEPLLAEHGFTFTQWVALMHLRDGLATNPRDICSLLRHDSGAVTRVIDQLEERGLVQRQRSLEDRREVDLHLTPVGASTVESLVPPMVDRMNSALRDFSSEEVAELTRLLVKLVATLSNAAGPAGPPAPAGERA
jgi:DNA-binding MarR family transcriptional regulator